MLRICNSTHDPAHFAAMRDWDDFKYFNAVARTGSVRGAGKELGVNASTVTRRLEQFEQRLGIRLFARTHSGLIITSEGAEVVHALDEVAVQLESIERNLKGRDAAMAGVVRINLPEVFHSDLFMAAVGRFSRQHPGVVVEVRSLWQPPDINTPELDLSVVLTEDPPENLIGRPLGRMRFAPYSLPEEKRDAGEDSLLDHGEVWLASALEAAVAPDYVARVHPTLRVGGYLETVELQLAGALAGMGSTLLPCHLGERHTQLVQGVGGVAEDHDLRRAVWLLSHPDSRGVARVQAVAELMIEALRSQNQ